MQPWEYRWILVPWPEDGPDDESELWQGRFEELGLAGWEAYSTSMDSVGVTYFLKRPVE